MSANTQSGRKGVRRVAVIGAGPAGLSAAHQLLSLSSTSSLAQPASSFTAQPDPEFRITLFDRRSNHAGVWGYDPNPGPCVIRYDSAGRAYPLWSGARKDGSDRGRFRPPGAMYDGLRTNLPCDIMTYRSSPYSSQTSLFPDRSTVESYINEFADQTLKLGERKGLHVRLGTAVSDVRRISYNPVPGKIGCGSEWSVKSIDVETGRERQEVYEHVVVASGRCNTPTIPYIEGLKRFRGQILHSAWWRSPLAYQDKTVLVVGNSSSGSDIARELAGYILRTLPEGSAATEAYVSRCKTQACGKILHSYEQYDKPPPLDYDPRDVASPDWARRIEVVPRIERIDEDGVVLFEGGQRKDGVEVIIFATGYAYDLPYLDQTLSPFDQQPLIPPPPIPKDSKVERLNEEMEGEVYEPPSRLAGFLTNLDDWSLFYAPDPSLCILGAPIRIVPMPLTHVQSRILAAAWAGSIFPSPNSTGLPRLNPNLPTTDPAKWTSILTSPNPENAEKEGKQKANKTSDLGYPSDTAYQNALLDLLPQHLRPRGADEATKVPEEVEAEGKEQQQQKKGGVGSKREARESLKPVVAKDEGWARMADFRNQRRADTKRLRRLLLGY